MKKRAVIAGRSYFWYIVCREIRWRFLSFTILELKDKIPLIYKNSFNENSMSQSQILALHQKFECLDKAIIFREHLQGEVPALEV